MSFGDSSSSGGFSFGGSDSSASSFSFGSSSGGFGFGSTPASSGSSSSSSNPSASFSFGGADSTFNFSATTSTSSAGVFGSAPANDGGVNSALQKLYDQYQNKLSVMCYNKVDPRDVGRFKKPDNVPEAQWNLAMKNNPDPRCLVPVKISNFNDLLKRVQQQKVAQTEFQNKLAEVRTVITDLQIQHDLLKKQEIENIKLKIVQQSHRLLKLMTIVETERAAGTPLLATEVDYRRRLQSLQRQLAKPLTRTRQLRASTVDVGMTLAIPASVASASTNNSAQQQQLLIQSSPLAGVVLDSQNAAKVHQFLDMQRQALKHAAITLKKDLKDVQLVMDGLHSLKTPGL